ncbi:hypothetical protein HPP92_022545 [Vanilla planifolia]|uniref:Uncharacterized protein n=1 Tax=Vanilla planifolia TaxID=51239 RepID=A0A835Q0T2_VANPL|nr:hypothetical protein HPP92_022545 [Vanilla planifolia]
MTCFNGKTLEKSREESKSTIKQTTEKRKTQGESTQERKTQGPNKVHLRPSFSRLTPPRAARSWGFKISSNFLSTRFSWASNQICVGDEKPTIKGEAKKSTLSSPHQKHHQALHPQPGH